MKARNTGAWSGIKSAYLPRVVAGVLAAPFPRQVHFLRVHRAVDQTVVHPEPLEVEEREDERRQDVLLREPKLDLHVRVRLEEVVVVQQLHRNGRRGHMNDMNACGTVRR